MTRPSAIRRAAPGAAHAAGLVAFAVAAWAPLLALAVPALARGAAGLDLPGDRELSLLARSVALCAGVALLATVVGTLAATLAFWQGVRLSGALRGALFAAVALPPAIQALAWWPVATGAGRVVPGAAAALWVQALTMLPVTTGLAWLSLEGVDPRLLDAARAGRRPASAFLRVALPLAGPLVLAGAGLVFVLSLVDFTVPSLFGLDVAALDLYAAIGASRAPADALGHALPLMTVAALVLAASQSGLRRAATTARADGPRRGRRPLGGDPMPAVLLGAATIAAIAAALPLVVPALALARGVDRRSLAATLAAAWPETRLSLLVASLAAATALPLAWAMSSELLGRGPRARLAWWAAVLPLAVPPPLAGLGLAVLWNHPGWPALQCTTVMPVLAALTRAAPLTAIVLAAQRRRTDAGLLEAARLFGRGRWHAWRAVHLPLVGRGVLAAAGLAFALALGELGATLIVVPPGAQTLTLRLYAFLHAGASEAVAALGLVLAALAALGAVVAGGLVRGGPSAREGRA